MAKRIVWSIKALFELKDILNFWALKTGNRRYSKKLNMELRATIRTVANQNYIGRQTEKSEARGMVCGNYLLFYRVDEK